jgi:hypothetical protein
VIAWGVPTAQTGKLEVDASVADNINLIVSPSIPLPSDLYDCPVKLVTKHSLKSPAISTKLTIHPLASKGELEVTKEFDHDLLSKAVLTVDSQKQNAKLVRHPHLWHALYTPGRM